MDEQTQIPNEIYARIQTKKALILEERRNEEYVRADKLAADVKQGRVLLLARIAEALEKCEIPQWLCDYEETEMEYVENDLERIGQGYNELDGNFKLYFTIPGLAPIQYQTNEKTWRSASVWSGFDDDDRKPGFVFRNDSYWRESLEYTLVEAETQMKKFISLSEDYAKREEEMRVRHQNEERREYERTIVSDAKEEAEDVEEQELFNALKDDRVAVLLMKVFLTIRQERSAFEQVVENANDSMDSMEEHWSRKAADLRRQADDADRRAAQEQSRASDLENDLDHAKKQLRRAREDFK